LKIVLKKIAPLKKSAARKLIINVNLYRLIGFFTLGKKLDSRSISMERNSASLEVQRFTTSDILCIKILNAPFSV
jgi:hypothetical protein